MAAVCAMTMMTTLIGHSRMATPVVALSVFMEMFPKKTGVVVVLDRHHVYPVSGWGGRHYRKNQ